MSLRSAAAQFPEVVGTEYPDHPNLSPALVRDLEQMRSAQITMLATHPAKDFHDYQKRIGVIEGLAIAIARAKQVNEKLNA